MGSRAIYGQFIKLKYESILAYNSFVEKNIDSAISEIEVKYEDFVNKNSNLELSNDNDDLDYYLTVVDDLAYQSQTLSKDIMQYHRKSILFQFYSLLEQEFHNSSKIIGVESLTSMKNSTGKTIIEKFKTYVNGIEPELIISIQSNLEFFDKLRLVRNIVIHENSVISTDNPHFNKIDSLVLIGMICIFRY